MSIKDLKTYQYIQNLDLDQVKFNYQQEIQVYSEINRICNICKEWTETTENKDPWNIPNNTTANKELGNACRNASIAAIWHMIKIMRHFDVNEIAEGPYGYPVNHETMDRQLWQRIENKSKTAVAERVGCILDTTQEALFSSSYKNKKLDKVDCWQIGNEYAEVMGVKIPHPDKNKMIKNVKRRTQRSLV